ncbi:acyl-CoA synthetase [Thalassovita mediterranea]|jgi:fatty-acyl-CoA synthase|uniref:Long-chain-fatty-acid--CoA ligase n=1 Tax=Thalassovita mediterranea TaxID=340021 RepID=A0A0P1GPI6_9RHOB|nr:acyl-CoA synthetase [Thalassovita mediterranea]CUH84424.1 Long-chain-fatty-acid--CoA ligase [Thalassovita mediterranea]SIS34204.1 fatty-acyl-CoA synthase [Thalassovita mediterranea]
MDDMNGFAQGFTNYQEIQAFEETPFLDHDMPATTYEALQKGTQLNPHSPALTFFISGEAYEKSYTLTHAELMAKVNQTANALRSIGIGRDDVVAFVLPNLPETHYVIWGGSAAGQVLAINPLLEADQIADLMRVANVQVLVTLEKTPKTDLWQKCVAALPSVPSIRQVITCSVFDWMDGPAAAIFGTLGKLRAAKLKVADRVVPVTSLSKLISGARADALTFEPPKGEDISTLLCTGGTTGLPKIARRTHFSEVFDCWAVSQYNPEHINQGAAIFVGLPLFHSNAILVTGLLPLMTGGHVILATPQGYRGDGVIKNFWKMADHFKFATFSGVPTVYAALLDLPRDGLDISSIRFGVCGAAPMPVELFNNFVKKTGVPIVEGYGMTEGAVASSLNPTDPEGGVRIGSIGLPLPYQKMRCAILRDDDTFERWADVDEAGVIMISGANVFEGYMIESQNKGIFFEIEGRRWFNSGDLARQDSDGYFWMTGRKKELIIRGGHNIDPKIIEEAMHAHSGIAMAAAVGRPDVKAGELPVLYYESTTGNDLSIDDLADFAMTHVSERAAVPKDFVRLDALPLTAVGKIHKPTLNMMEIERAIRAEAQATGSEIAALDVVQDSKRGVVAKLQLKSGIDEMRHVLGNYTFAVDYIA